MSPGMPLANDWARKRSCSSPVCPQSVTEQRVATRPWVFLRNGTLFFWASEASSVLCCCPSAFLDQSYFFSFPLTRDAPQQTCFTPASAKTEAEVPAMWPGSDSCFPFFGSKVLQTIDVVQRITEPDSCSHLILLLEYRRKKVPFILQPHKKPHGLGPFSSLNCDQRNSILPIKAHPKN